ncbi:hypothetical protein RCI26_31050 (plasmid) [Bacillus thuringiensis serovar tenebrionis]|uniref:hypothetical protein n=1 Tax=Bacillus thuringiensis TaxID=1428 RepID=UPI0006976CF2|nr:hypothetical protein [Bacillus thuringiensis]MRA99789.1 hypothetical protein [Bacillus thuringiensis]OTY47678.1 hypothetical protein BK736_00540 [Bacillus thuringiensis serovar poloniensis]RNG26427.1 hypothetical protein EEL55_27690 [Bacillus thuringiensis]UEL01220.1 hypothetical protein K8Z23_30015 [Bacillus thuringiensis]WMR16110.1 hypothetical protein RCI27_30350 [Bacillus thuringiensis serovar tenebrionis]
MFKIEIPFRFINLISQVLLRIKTPTDKYFVWVLIEENEQLFPRFDTKIDIDVVLKDFTILSNDTKYGNANWLRKAEKIYFFAIFFDPQQEKFM